MKSITILIIVFAIVFLVIVIGILNHKRIILYIHKDVLNSVSNNNLSNNKLNNSVKKTHNLTQ